MKRKSDGSEWRLLDTGERHRVLLVRASDDREVLELAPDRVEELFEGPWAQPSAERRVMGERETPTSALAPAESEESEGDHEPAEPAQGVGEPHAAELSEPEAGPGARAAQRARRRK